MAVDMPRVTAATIARLLDAMTGHDGAVLCDTDGRRQLVWVVLTDRLDPVVPLDPHGRSVRDLLADLDLAEVAQVGDEAHGVDRWEDLRDLERGD
jgi:CTP:molybdopterin cytidylyltransferase MocA